ncbi:MAG: RpiB/LacA/LacB family sugar-phosphate isomerase [Sedimentisphaerales bacterium]|nr:RpiB/LacA/LacB family sugar-phosphate isomerase [Sedimentisphaerales bacterium]
MKIAIDADCNGTELKKELCDLLKEKNVDFQDLAYIDSHQGDYPDVACNLALQIQKGNFDRGILICGTGLGVAMCANKVKGIFAGVCHDVYSAERLRKSNNAQIITLGALIIGPQLARTIISAWLDSEYQGGRSAPKVDRMRELEDELSQGN